MAMGGGLAICGRGIAGLSLASDLMPEEGAFPSPMARHVSVRRCVRIVRYYHNRFLKVLVERQLPGNG